jgi:hypothetical protein
MMFGGAIAGGGGYALLSGNGPDGTLFAAFVTLGASVGAVPYAKVMQKYDDGLEKANDPPPGKSGVSSPRRIGRSIFAVIFGLVFYLISVFGYDALLVDFHVFPPLDQPMTSVADNAIALGGRAGFMVFVGYFAAAIAPRHPMRHALILGAILLLLSAGGAMLAANLDSAAPTWYLIGLPAVALPCAWIGAVLARRYAPAIP